MKKLIFVFAMLASIYSITSCSSLPEEPTTDEYSRDVEKFSAGDAQYEGAYNNFDYRVTVMSEQMQRIYINKKAEMYLWSDEKKLAELKSLQTNNGERSQIFLSFFTPSRSDDNLSSSKSIWAVYLQNGNTRYEGRVTKNRSSRTELNVLYPYHGRFTSAYSVDFPVSVNQLDMQNLKVTITGPLGTKSVEFSKANH